jgi:hypothetical protein
VAVLQGSLKTIDREKSYIIFEANPTTSCAAGYAIEDLFEWLTSRDFELVTIGPRGECLPLQSELRFGNVLATPRG